MKPIFRNPDKLQVLPYREWLRHNMPNAGYGFVVEDLDLVVRWFGQNYGFDSTGAFMLIELKHGNSDLGIAQTKLWGLIDGMLRKADPEYKRYFGFYLIQYSCEDWDTALFRINHHAVTKEQFIGFWERRFVINSYFEK